MTGLRWLALIALFIFARDAAAVEPDDYAFQLSAQALVSPARIVLSWPANAARQIVARRKLPTDTEWGPVIATLPEDSTQLVDGDVDIGKVYEYQFSGVIADVPDTQVAYGYIAAGVDVYAIERRGKIVLIVDRTHADALAAELETLRQDLIGDGWSVARRDVSPGDSAPQVKALIKAEYTADPANVRAVFLIGHIAVPYSGLIDPDMHDSHKGAWPADVYYGEMDGTWTDSTVNKTDSEYEENDNVPGDGKFDQSTIPGTVELEVGRVDMSNLPSFAPRTERELLRNYLNKDHRFRHHLFEVSPRGLIRDTFGTIDEDAPAVDAWRAFPALFGPGAIREAGYNGYFAALFNESFLFSYGGGGGDFTKADGVGTTTDFAHNDPKSVFLLLHGSYFGDWNNDDNFLRAAIATPTYSLVAIWSSLPHWYFHPLALGETIGYATRLVQNNRGLYLNNIDYSFGEVHISMLGDPTLRPFVSPPPKNLRISGGATVMLSWDAAAGADGYHVYRAPTSEGPFVRLNRAMILDTSYEMPPPSAGDYVYMVKTETTDVTGGGTFHNRSQGISISYTQTVVQTATVNVTALDSIGSESGDPIVLQFTRDVANTALSVNIELSGSATEGVDYPAIPNVISFQAGETETKLTIVPSSDEVSEMEESITATILSGAGYNVGNANSASAVISANGESKIQSWGLTETGAFKLTANGFANRPCRVESRPQDGSWRTRENLTAGADGLITYQESVPVSGACELYRLVWE